MQVEKNIFTVHPKAKAPAMTYEGVCLSDVYGRWSNEKQKAFDKCVELCMNLNGKSFCITSHNTSYFSVMFDFEHPETGNRMRAHITPSTNHAYYL